MKHNQLMFFNEEEQEQSKLSVTKDKLYLSLVCLILLLVITFSLGVERGKKVSLSTQKQVLQELNLIENATAASVAIPLSGGSTAVEVVTERPEPVIVSPEVIKLAPEIMPRALIQPKKQNLSDSTVLADHSKNVSKSPIEGSLTIQLASYAQESTAKEESKKLEKKGYVAFIVVKGKYVILCVGQFKDKAEARKTQSILKKNYKDCFIRQM
jgi:cell division septation protein DedD